MKTLFQKEVVDEIINRINKLSATTQRQWGKMNVDQMLAHNATTMQTATGELFLPQIFIGKILAPFMKSQTTNDKPFRKNGPTNPVFIKVNTEGLEKEKQNLIKLINQFHMGGEAKCTTNPHSFYGKLSPTEWSSLMYKHLDHHLRQFGV